MSSIHVTLPDGSRKELPAGADGSALAASIGPRLAKAAVGAKVNGEVVDLMRPLEDGDRVEILTFDSVDGRDVFRHSAAHLMASAILRVRPDTRLAGVEVHGARVRMGERLAAEARDRARRQVHAGLVLEAVARQEALAVDPAEVDARIARLAEGGKQTPESVRRRLEASGRLDDLRASLLEEKTLEYLVAKAHVG